MNYYFLFDFINIFALFMKFLEINVVFIIFG